jgi:hypothetical protein
MSGRSAVTAHVQGQRVRVNCGILSDQKFFGFGHNFKREIVSPIFAMFKR